MSQKPARTMEELLSSTDPEELRQGIKMAGTNISMGGPEEGKRILELITPIFYLDPLDHPELVPILDEAVTLVSRFGNWVIPLLVKELETADVKAQLVVSHVLGRIGVHAIDPLLAEFNDAFNPARRSFLLYALGKIKSPEIARATSLAIESCFSTDLDLRDTAVRAIGKFAESIPESSLSGGLRKECVAALKRNLADQNLGIRSKAVRAIGKMAKFGHLTGEEKEKFRDTFRLILGKDESFSWDRAFLVRKEAKEALEYL